MSSGLYRLPVGVASRLLEDRLSTRLDPNPNVASSAAFLRRLIKHRKYVLLANAPLRQLLPCPSEPRLIRPISRRRPRLGLCSIYIPDLAGSGRPSLLNAVASLNPQLLHRFFGRPGQTLFILHHRLLGHSKKQTELGLRHITAPFAEVCREIAFGNYFHG